MSAIQLGCSGWDYRDWADVFYEDKDESKLRAYSRIFNTLPRSTLYDVVALLFFRYDSTASMHISGTEDESPAPGRSLRG
jgi:hypothetical protein